MLRLPAATAAKKHIYDTKAHKTARALQWSMTARSTGLLPRFMLQDGQQESSVTASHAPHSDCGSRNPSAGAAPTSRVVRGTMTSAAIARTPRKAESTCQPHTQRRGMHRNARRVRTLLRAQRQILDLFRSRHGCAVLHKALSLRTARKPTAAQTRQRDTSDFSRVPCRIPTRAAHVHVA